jgi:hypothetical protein
MTRYVKGYTGPMKPAAGPRGSKTPGIKDFLNGIAVGPRRPPEKPTTGSGSLGFIIDKVKSIPGFGFKKGGKTTTLHSITKSNKKSNW